MNKIYEYDDSEHARIAGVSKAKVALNSNVIAFGRYSVYIAAVPKVDSSRYRNCMKYESQRVHSEGLLDVCKQHIFLCSRKKTGD